MDFVRGPEMGLAAGGSRGCIHEHMVKDNAHSREHGRRVPNLTTLRKEAAGCTACSLYKNATQTVFGEGPQHARVMMIGEQPGDQEDRQGHPFVGPAGTLLNKALAAVGISRDEVYVTNIVKHFKWEPRGKRRIHKKPSAIEISACRQWLDSEIAFVRPQIIVLLGATAAQSIMGRHFLVSQQRGRWVSSAIAPHVLATVHPSSILRAADEKSRHEELANFVEDLRPVAALMRERAAA
ncbi:MAG TPA: UdgX family uracil-DNA binding protein [Candidatus Angelobacter sp.]|nr:UdgX family uracil-DNA binding protein [Candidatus Angelobacter sp.]